MYIPVAGGGWSRRHFTARCPLGAYINTLFETEYCTVSSLSIVDGAELDPEKGVHNSPRTFLLGFAQYIIADKSLFVDAVRQQKDK